MKRSGSEGAMRQRQKCRRRNLLCKQRFRERQKVLNFTAKRDQVQRQSPAALKARFASAFGVAVATILTSQLAAAKDAANAKLRVPFSIPIDLNAEKTLEFKFCIASERAYAFNVQLYFANQTERAIVREAIGDADTHCRSQNSCGFPLEYEVQIKNKSGELIFNKTVDAIGHYAFSADHFVRNVIKLRLAPGDYEAKFKPVKTGVARSNIGSRFAMTYYANERVKWTRKMYRCLNSTSGSQ